MGQTQRCQVPANGCGEETCQGESEEGTRVEEEEVMSLKGFSYDLAIIANNCQEWRTCGGDVENLVKGDMVLIASGHDYIVPVDVAHTVAREIGVIELIGCHVGK